MRRHGKTMRIVEQRPIQEFVPKSGQYVVNPSGRFVWLQRLAEAVLRRFGMDAVMLETVRVEQVTVDTERMFDLVGEQIEIAYRSSGGPPAHIYLGPDQLREVMVEEQGPTSRLSAFSGDAGEYGYNRQIFGLNYTLVPWLDGVVVVPARRN